MNIFKNCEIRYNIYEVTLFMKLINRSLYINQLINVKDVPDIKVITGVRRAGKSKLMDAYHAILNEDKSNNIIHIKLNTKEYSNLLDGESLYNYVSSKYDKTKKNYLLIDEVQMCNNFERIINYLYE